jgi:hypothetical protein
MESELQKRPNPRAESPSLFAPFGHSHLHVFRPEHQATANFRGEGVHLVAPFVISVTLFEQGSTLQNG